MLEILAKSIDEMEAYLRLMRQKFVRESGMDERLQRHLGLSDNQAYKHDIRFDSSQKS